MKTAHEEEKERQQLEIAGEKIAEILNLKQARYDDGSKRGRPYDPPRYHTAWGTKSALGLAITVRSILNNPDD